MSRRSLRLAAPAKVNLGLRVAAKRGDGFHEIDTVFALVDLADHLTLVVAESGVVGTLRPGPSLPPGTAPPMDDANLAVRAARAWLEATGIRVGVRIELEKHVPVAAGLGGGSSDAGAVLRGLARLWPDAAPAKETLAADLGSDVPFFARSLPAARGRGRGERLDPVELPPGHLVLVNPGPGISAAEAYAQLTGFGPPLQHEDIVGALRRGEPPPWRNDLQPGVLRRWPVVREALEVLRGAGLAAPILSGSGPTCFGLAGDAAHARQAAAAIAAARPGWWCTAARLQGG